MIINKRKRQNVKKVLKKTVELTSKFVVVFVPCVYVAMK